MHATLVASVLVAAIVSSVQAHGIVYTIDVSDGQTFQSPLIGGSGTTGPFWLVSDNSPVDDPTSSTLFCGNVAKVSSSSPTVAAGSTMTFNWNSGYTVGTHWPHNTGPMFLYMAKCDGDCSAATPATSKFFKVAQMGYASSGVWKQAAVMAGQGVTFTIPSDLAPGNYLFRHEIINLALTHEMFPACSSFTVTGSGSNTYSSFATASFPGTYKVTDPGLAVAGTPVYSITSDAGYTFPGPDPITVGSNSGSGNTDTTSTKEAATSTTEAATSTEATTSTTETTATTSAIVNVGGDPSVTLSATTSAATSTETSTSSTSDSGTGSSTSSTSSSGSSSGSSIADCDTAWTACNANYMALTTPDPSSYTCQTDYVSCIQGAMNTTTSRRRNHYRRAHGLSRLDSIH